MPDRAWKSDQQLINLVNVEMESSDLVDRYPMQMLMSQTSVEYAKYSEPKSIENAWARPGKEGEKWREASDEEVKWMIEKGVVKPVDKKDYEGKHVLNSGWGFRTKRDKFNNIKRQRARFFPKGCSQVMYADYHPNEVASPVMRKSSLLIIFVICVENKLMTRTIDITKAFFTGELDEIVLSKLPPGYRNDPNVAIHGTDTLWLYLRAAYGLKQAAYKFHTKYVKALVAAGYVQCLSDTCVLMRRDGKDFIIIGLWVDDNIIAYSSEHMLQHLFRTIKEAGYQYTDEGEWDRILGMDVSYDRDKGELKYSHKSYINNLLATLGWDKIPIRSVPVKTTKKFSLVDRTGGLSEKDYKLFRSALGGIGHVQRWTHNEIAYGVGIVSQVMNAPGAEHLEYLKDIAGYMRGACDKVNDSFPHRLH